MDSLTQLALGAAIGEATLGKKLGYKGALWGGFFGTLPDLDIVANLFLSEVDQLSFHRGITHSIFFCVLAAPVLAYGLQRLHRRSGIDWRRWTAFLLLTLNTHWMIDSLTTYGTQIYRPFTDYPVSVSSVFIIDPVYTLPLLMGLGIALLRPRGTPERFRANAFGLGLSTAYLLATLLLKLHVTSVFDRALDDAGIRYTQVMNTPTALTSLLWTGIADDGEALWVGLYSFFDEQPITFKRIDKRAELLAPYRTEEAVERLLWFSRGYFVVSQHPDGQLTFHDARFGRLDLWAADTGAYIFNFDLLPDAEDPAQLRGFTLRQPDVGLTRAQFQALWDRTLGRPVAL